MKSKIVKNIFFLIFTSALGMISVVVPIFGDVVKRKNIPSILSLIHYGIEKFSFYTLIFLVFSGVLIGFIKHQKAWLWSIMIVLYLPIISIIEVMLNPHTHNLLPFEILFYFLMTVPCIVGAIASSFIRKWGNG